MYLQFTFSLVESNTSTINHVAGNYPAFVVAPYITGVGGTSAVAKRVKGDTGLGVCLQKYLFVQVAARRAPAPWFDAFRTSSTGRAVIGRTELVTCLLEPVVNTDSFQHRLLPLCRAASLA